MDISKTWTESAFSRLREYLQECFAIDCRSLALFRIAIAIILLLETSSMWEWAQPMYGKNNISSSEVVGAHLFSSNGKWSIYNAIDSLPLKHFLLSLQFTLSLLLLFGIFSRHCLFLLWILLLSAHNNNPIINHGGDTILRLLLFWSLFLPLDRRYTIFSKNDKLDLQPAKVYNVASFVILMQIASIYFITGIAKSGSLWRNDSTAIYYALLQGNYTSDIGHWFTRFPSLLYILTKAVLALEDCVFLLIFCPVYPSTVRLVAVPIFLAFHLLGIATCFRLGLFPWICSAAWLLFIPSKFYSILPFGTKNNIQQGNISNNKEYDQEKTSPYAHLINFGIVILFLFGISSGIGRAIPSLAYIRQVPFLKKTNNFLGLTQNWNLFAPNPVLSTKDYRLKLKFSDHTYTSIPFSNALQQVKHQNGAPKKQMNIRWRKALMTISNEKQTNRHHNLLPYIAENIKELFPGKEIIEITLIELSNYNWPTQSEIRRERSLLVMPIIQTTDEK